MRRLCVLVALATVLLLASATGATARSKPTVVLVHGAFADASGWTGVIHRLHRDGYPVVAPPNPLRGVMADAAYVRSVLATIHEPIVLVGHSYGGMVISNAATGVSNVKALVYVAAYAPDEGDTVATLSALAPGGMIGPATLDFRTVPAPDGTTTTVEGSIKPSVFRKIFAADLPRRETVPMAAEQRPLVASALGEPSGPPAWKTVRSWYVLPGKDLAIGTAAERIMARRIGAKTVSVPGASHVVMISRPGRVTKVIERAARRSG